MLRHRNFQSVIGPLTLEAAFYLIFFSNFRFIRALISRSGAVVQQKFSKCDRTPKFRF